MNKKIVVIVIAALLLIGTGVACTMKISERQPEPEGGYTIDFVEQYIAEKLSDKNNDVVPCFKEEDLLYDTGCFALGADAGYYSGASGFITNLFERVVKIFPNPLIRENDDDIITVYDTDNHTRLYLFFSKKSKGMFTDGFPVVMKEKLSYSDFSQLKLGDNLNMVESIDSIMPLYTRYFDQATDSVLERNKKVGRYLTSIHLLSDGILKIEYDKVDGNYVITNIVYNKDFILDGLNGKTCYKILDEDYVD